MSYLFVWIPTVLAYGTGWAAIAFLVGLWTAGTGEISGIVSEAFGMTSIVATAYALTIGAIAHLGWHLCERHTSRERAAIGAGISTMGAIALFTIAASIDLSRIAIHVDRLMACAIGLSILPANAFLFLAYHVVGEEDSPQDPGTEG